MAPSKPTSRAVGSGAEETAGSVEGFAELLPILRVSSSQITHGRHSHGLPGDSPAPLLGPRLVREVRERESSVHERALPPRVPGLDHALGAELPLDFETVYTTYFHSVARWVRAFGGLNADIDDLTQEVFLIVERRMHSFQGGNLAAWLYGITRRTVRDHRRKAWFRRWLSGADPEVADAGAETPDPSASFERGEAKRLVATILQDMSAVRRSTFVLFEIEGYSGEEIALLEGVPVNTVYTRLHHARKDFFRLMAARLRIGEEP
jgi:RNA polymerase sigma-70 factor (ECF subfamily)